MLYRLFDWLLPEEVKVPHYEGLEVFQRRYLAEATGNCGLVQLVQLVIINLFGMIFLKSQVHEVEGQFCAEASQLVLDAVRHEHCLLITDLAVEGSQLWTKSINWWVNLGQMRSKHAGTDSANYELAYDKWNQPSTLLMIVDSADSESKIATKIRNIVNQGSKFDVRSCNRAKSQVRERSHRTDSLLLRTLCYRFKGWEGDFAYPRGVKCIFWYCDSVDGPSSTVLVYKSAEWYAVGTYCLQSARSWISKSSVISSAICLKTVLVEFIFLIES